MPAYVFKCKACLSMHEVVAPIADKPDTLECPDCGGDTHRAWAEEAGDWWVEGLAKDRFKMRDRIMKNREKAEKRGFNMDRAQGGLGDL